MFCRQKGANVRILRVSHSAVVAAWRERERELRALGHDVVTLSAQRWDEGGVAVTVQPLPAEQVTGVRTFGRHPALFVYDPKPLWRALGETWDVIELHEEPFALATAEILALRALRQQRAPYSLYSAQNIRKRYPVPFRWFERWALRRAAAVSVCNIEAGRICEDKGFPGKARLIPLGLDVRHFSPAADRAARRDGVVVGYVGRFAPHKGVDVLLAAVTGDQRLTLRLAGAGPQQAELSALVERLGLLGRVEFVGSLGQDALPDFYRSLDVLAVPSLPTPSWLEQFGRVAVEAMACGVPVVASDSGALADVVGGAGLLVPPGDVDRLREALLRVGDDPGLAERLRAGGLAFAANCDWPVVAKSYLELYATIARSAPPRRGK